MSGRSAVVAAGTAVLLFVLFILHFAAPSALTALAMPLWRSGAAISSMVHSSSPTVSKGELVAEKDRLAQENVALVIQNATLSAQLADLTALLGTRTQPEKGIVASVRARPPVAPYDVLIIDQGTEAGVAAGALALGPGGTPLGTVGFAESGSSRVALFSTHGIETAGWAGQSRIPLTLTGAGAGAFRASVAKEAGVQVGDGVYIAASGAVPIGTVVSIESDPSSPQVGLDVRPYVNPFSLTWVTISRR